jgi:hypothetical protein
VLELVGGRRDEGHVRVHVSRSEEANLDLEGLDSFALARIAQIQAKRRAVMPPNVVGLVYI